MIFFNNVGYLNMCGHGTIGLVVTLAHMGRIRGGACRLDTVCGVVDARLVDANRVTIRNVPSYRSAAKVPVDAPGIGTVYGDIAWGGNWFFLVADHGQVLALDRLEELTDYTWRIRQGLEAAGITGGDGREIDHIELFGPPTVAGADSRNFVLCPGKAYDRSPCGTGTSAKLACLYADGKLLPGRGVAAGEHRRQRLRRPGQPRGRADHPRNHRLRVCERRGRPDPRRARPLLLRNPRHMG